MTLHYLQPTDRTARELISRTFPEFTGNRISLQVHSSGSMNLASYWSGGSRSYFAVIRLSDSKTFHVPQNGSGFDPYGTGIKLDLPAPDYAIVEHAYSGQDQSIRIHVHADNAAPLLPAPTALSWTEKVVLASTRSVKSSYAGIKDYRFHEAQTTGITREEWDAAKAALIARKLLNNAGAITVDGRNAIGRTDLYSLRRTDASD